MENAIIIEGPILSVTLTLSVAEVATLTVNGTVVYEGGDLDYAQRERYRYEKKLAREVGKQG